MLQSLETSKNLAIYKDGGVGAPAVLAIEESIAVVDLALQIMVIVVFVVFAVFWLHGLWLRRGEISSAIQSARRKVGAQCSCCLRCPCGLRWCARPQCCRRRVSAPPTTAPAMPSHAIHVGSVEMMSNPLSSIRLARERSSGEGKANNDSSKKNRDGVPDTAGNTRTPSDILNPAYASSAEMVELNRRNNSVKSYRSSVGV